MQRIISKLLIIACLFLAMPAAAAGQDAKAEKQNTEAAAAKAAKPDTTAAIADTTAVEDADTAAVNDALDGLDDEEPQSFHQVLKTKFIEGSAGFMSLVALALVLGLAFCIERIIYLALSEINAKKMMADISKEMKAGNVDGAKKVCRENRGPVAAISLQALERVGDGIADIERSIQSYGSVEAAKLERGCSWITLFIAIAPSLGFLGTVIGMVMAFEQIQTAGDISPTIVASGMKVALITTIFGIIAALILQVFYNYILSKIDHITSQMEESAIALLDAIVEYKRRVAE